MPTNRKENLRRFLILHHKVECDALISQPNSDLQALRTLLLKPPIFLMLFGLFMILAFKYGWADTSEQLALLNAIFSLYAMAAISLILSWQFFISSWGLLWHFFLYVFSAITLISLFGVIYYKFGAITGGEHYKATLDDAVYFSFITWTTVGYGDLTPIGYGKFLAAIEGFISLIFMGLLIAKLQYLFIRRDE